MANHIVNDRGETVIAEGAPGSLARVITERPALLDDLKRLKSEGISQGEAQQVLQAIGVTGIEMTSVIAASAYGGEQRP